MSQLLCRRRHHFKGVNEPKTTGSYWEDSLLYHPGKMTGGLRVHGRQSQKRMQACLAGVCVSGSLAVRQRSYTSLKKGGSGFSGECGGLCQAAELSPPGAKQALLL